MDLKRDLLVNKGIEGVRVRMQYEDSFNFDLKSSCSLGTHDENNAIILKGNAMGQEKNSIYKFIVADDYSSLLELCRENTSVLFPPSRDDHSQLQNSSDVSHSRLDEGGGGKKTFKLPLAYAIELGSNNAIRAIIECGGISTLFIKSIDREVEEESFEFTVSREQMLNLDASTLDMLDKSLSDYFFSVQLADEDFVPSRPIRRHWSTVVQKSKEMEENLNENAEKLTSSSSSSLPSLSLSPLNTNGDDKNNLLDVSCIKCKQMYKTLFNPSKCCNCSRQNFISTQKKYSTKLVGKLTLNCSYCAYPADPSVNRDHNWYCNQCGAVNEPDAKTKSNFLEFKPANKVFVNQSSSNGTFAAVKIVDLPPHYKAVSQVYCCVAYSRLDMGAWNGVDKEKAEKIYTVNTGDCVKVVGICTFNGAIRARLSDGNWVTVKDSNGDVFFEPSEESSSTTNSEPLTTAASKFSSKITTLFVCLLYIILQSNFVTDVITNHLQTQISGLDKDIQPGRVQPFKSATFLSASLLILAYSAYSARQEAKYISNFKPHVHDIVPRALIKLFCHPGNKISFIFLGGMVGLSFICGSLRISDTVVALLFSFYIIAYKFNNSIDTGASPFDVKKQSVLGFRLVLALICLLASIVCFIDWNLQQPKESGTKNSLDGGIGFCVFSLFFFFLYCVFKADFLIGLCLGSFAVAVILFLLGFGFHMVEIMKLSYYAIAIGNYFLVKLLSLFFGFFIILPRITICNFFIIYFLQFLNSNLSAICALSILLKSFLDSRKVKNPRFLSMPSMIKNSANSIFDRSRNAKHTSTSINLWGLKIVKEGIKSIPSELLSMYKCNNLLLLTEVECCGDLQNNHNGSAIECIVCNAEYSNNLTMVLDIDTSKNCLVHNSAIKYIDEPSVSMLRSGMLIPRNELVNQNKWVPTEGDKVKLNNSGLLNYINNSNVCLNSARSEGTIQKIRKSGNKTIDVLSGSITSAYNLSDLCCVTAGMFKVGDLVTLSPSFNENKGDGWCLGKKSDPISTVGIVVMAPMTENPQKLIGVVSILDESRVFFFKNSWLEHVENMGNTKFEVGQRVVQDNIRAAHYKLDGKCLDHASYGIVVDGGEVLDDSSEFIRNVQVLSIPNPLTTSLIGPGVDKSVDNALKKELSFFPAFELMPAFRVSAYLRDDFDSIGKFVKDLLEEIDFDVKNFDIDHLIQSEGIHIWGRLLEMSADSYNNLEPNLIKNFWEKWNSSRSTEWLDNEPSLEALVKPDLPYDSDESHYCDVISLNSRNIDSKSLPKTWKCSSANLRSGLTCNGVENSMIQENCRICKHPADPWSCAFCQSSNKYCDFKCSFCKMWRIDSEVLVKKYENTTLSKKQLAILTSLERDYEKLGLISTLRDRKAVSIPFHRYSSVIIYSDVVNATNNKSLSSFNVNKATLGSLPLPSNFELKLNAEIQLSTKRMNKRISRNNEDNLWCLTDTKSILHSVDRGGNIICHHLAAGLLPTALSTLFELGAHAHAENFHLQTPTSILHNITFKEKRQLSLHRFISRRGLVNCKVVAQAILNTPVNYQTDPSYGSFIKAVREPGGSAEEDADFYIREALNNNVPHAKLYRALFYLEKNYGEVHTDAELSGYVLEQESILKSLESNSSNTVEWNAIETYFDPLYFYVKFRLFKRKDGAVLSFSKKKKLLALDAYMAFQCFPEMAALWLDPKEDFIEELLAEGLHEDTEVIDTTNEDGNGGENDENGDGNEHELNSLVVKEDDYSSLLPSPGPTDPESRWANAKTAHKLESPSMDLLMSLIGLKAVKQKAIDIALTVLLQPPSNLDTRTSMNLTFIGNPGTGKTEVASLLAKSLEELGITQTGTIHMTADDILEQGGDAHLKGLLRGQDSRRIMIIDDAHILDPSPKGKIKNESRKIVNSILEYSDPKSIINSSSLNGYTRQPTSFILIGYKDEMADLFASTPGLHSRFPKAFTFEFSDYNENELTNILAIVTSKRNYKFEHSAKCGVPIAKVLARRLAKGANTKMFSNGRECLNVLDSCRQRQDSRLVTMLDQGKKLTEYDYKTILRKDAIGDRPKLEESPYMHRLNEMTGLRLVKEKIKNLMNLQLQNWDAEMRGDKIQLISLHRVFFGNPGTGKTSIAKLYGLMLKEFGFLSDGDLVIVTPADLKGSAVGEAAANTKRLLDGAKGKVVFIDEAYNLDPARGSGMFGAEVLDVILEKIEGNVGSDICLIMAGYKPHMQQLFRSVKNPGLKRRFNLGEAFEFEDFSDEEIREILKNQIVANDLFAEPETLDHAIKLITQKRMEEGFGNAGEAEQILSRAKLKRASRLAVAGAVPRSLQKTLIAQDFDGDTTLSIQKAREVFDDLYNIDHINAVLKTFEALCAVSDSENRPRHTIIEDYHMLFIGPPGTGKTTAGKKLASMLKLLGILPSDTFVYTTAGKLVDRYVGGTGNNTLDIMRQAKGGVLMIDEAYGMLPKNNSYGKDIVQALLDNVTSEEFKGKIVIILAGYKEHVDEIFTLNPGLQSRFDKLRIEFPEWSGTMASDALVKTIIKEGKSIDGDAIESMRANFSAMQKLPNWASARDTFEVIKKKLESKRAVRQYEFAEEMKRNSMALSQGRAPKHLSPPPLPYNKVDVDLTFKDVLKDRGGVGLMNSSLGDDRVSLMSNSSGGISISSSDGIGGITGNGLPLSNDSRAAATLPAYNGAAVYRLNCEFAKRKENTLDPRVDSDDSDISDMEVWACLEKACADLKYSPSSMRDMLMDVASFPPPDIMANIIAQLQDRNNCDDSKIKPMLSQQREKVLTVVNKAIQEENNWGSEEKCLSAEEMDIQARLKAIGLCPAGYKWHREGSGWRCGGGTHFVTQEQLNWHAMNDQKREKKVL